MEWLFLFLSFPIAVLAARADVFFVWAVARLRYGKLSIRGHWAEWIPGSAGRQFSIGTIQYNVFQRRYNFDGTNYRNNGNPFCHWRTVTSYLDFSKLEFHYVFATKDVDSMQTTSYGYGVLQLISRDGSLIPEDGYYIYANGHDAAVSHSHTLVPVVKVPDNRNDNATKLLTATFPGHADALE